MDDLTFLDKFIIWSVPILFAITVHEVSHGWVASRLGDQTAKKMGRLTLNPFKHIDPIGTVALPIMMLMVSNFVFGWAKPVPVDWRNLGHPRRDMALVAVAGPAANLFMMLLWLCIAKLTVITGMDNLMAGQFILYMCSAGIIINIVLMILNMFPLLPLDGGRVMTSMLPSNLAQKYSKLEPYGLVILLVLLVTGVLGKLIGPLIQQLSLMVFKLI